MHGLARVGIDHRHHGVDQRARREVLSGAGLHLLGIALKQALVDRAFDVDALFEPAFAVDQADDPLELGRVLDFVLRFEEDGADHAGLARQLVEYLGVALGQFLALQIAKPAPLAILGDRRAVRPQQALRHKLGALVVHLEKQQIGNLRDVGLVGYALVAQHMGVVPDFLDKGGFVHDAIFRPRARRTAGASARRRARRTEAGSSFGSCGTRRPSKADFRIDWRRAAAPERLSINVACGVFRRSELLGQTLCQYFNLRIRRQWNTQF